MDKQYICVCAGRTAAPGDVALEGFTGSGGVVSEGAGEAPVITPAAVVGVAVDGS